ncbi:hypothetical protein SAMN05421753_10479 [Planctomicrobium piriforme]|uniref:Uncharacterized protein n=1 Tax=Planctomicrobium piriforme TaxID=1576369 RepID=A0A1I3E4L7_9PLAN|nr:hypothetical protein SAMN05421753_10479 [Planctomicrobium piriforme]
MLSENGDVECIGGRLSISLGSEKDPAVICEIIPEGATRGEWHYQKDASNLHYIQVLYETSDGDRDVAFLMKKAPEGYDLYLIFDPDIYLPPMTRIK